MEPDTTPKAQLPIPLDLLIVMSISIVSIVLALALPDGNILRVLFGIPLLLLFPGYALVSVIWPAKSLQDIERLSLSIGLSIALSAIVGTVLAYADALTLIAITGTLAVIIIALCLVSVVLRKRLSPDEVFVFAFPKVMFAAPSGADRVIVLVLAISVVISGIALGYLMTQPVEEAPYSEFYILDVNGTANNYPINISTNQVGQVIVGVVCHEQVQTDYEILFGLPSSPDSGLNSTWDEPQLLNNRPLTHRNITLRDGQVFEGNCSFIFNSPGMYQVTWELLIDGQATDYEVHLWVEVH